MSFKDDERKPGEETNLILKATPGSRVAFVAVDKSIHLLKAGNELTKEKVCTEIYVVMLSRSVACKHESQRRSHRPRKSIFTILTDDFN